MPELPDVEYYRTYAQATSLHKEIADSVLTAPRLLEDTSRQLLSRRLKGESFEEARRHGKHLFLVHSSGGALMLHFGMTGLLKYYEEADDPERSRLIVRFANGGSLAYINTRMLGKIAIVDSIEEYVKEAGLGPDALELTVDELRDLIRNSRGSIKTTLTNQSRIAGLGNVYGDEVLYQAGIDPRRACGDISDEEVSKIHRLLRDVSDSAARARGNPKDMPDTFLLRHREPGAECPRCAGTVSKITLGGRSSYLCEACQS